MSQFVEMKKQLSQSPLGAVLREWLEEKRKSYCDVESLKGPEDLNSARHVSRVLKEIIQELKLVDRSNPASLNEYQ